MDILNSYFENLVFSQIEEKEGFVIYGAGISSGLGAGKSRYVLLFVPKQFANKQRARIHDLKWQNLQTRELQYSYNLKKQPWSMDRNAKDILLGVTDRNKKYNTFKSVDTNFPFEILLLNDPKKKTIYQYRNRLTLTAAIEIFNSIFNFTGELTPDNNYQPSPLENWFPYSMEDEDDSFELLN